MNNIRHLLFSVACIIALICSCDITQEREVPVESVSLSQPIAELLVGESIQLIAIISPKQATDQTVIWASSKPSVAIVSDDGIVTALTEGESTILANAGGKSASCIVTVTSSSSSDVSVTGVALDKTSLTLVVGEEATLKATVKPDNAPNKEVTWVSDKTSVATVDGNGKVSAKAVGEANITVLTKIGGKRAVCNVTVTAESVKVTGISLNKSSMTIEVGETQSLVATITPSNATNKKVNWVCNDPTVASVDENGNVTGKGLGNATIIATTVDGGKKATCSVKVTSSSSNVAVTGVSLDKTSLTLSVGESVTLNATVKPDNASNKQVSWSSSATGIATVDGNGTVTAKATGSANITVTTKDGGLTASCVVTVSFLEPEAVDLGLSVKWASFNVGATMPEEYGEYYAWGETKPKENYNWSTYKWCNGDYNKLTKYCTNSSYWDSPKPMDNKTTLDIEDDAAHVNWGGGWRIPTDEEWWELIKECTSTWTTQNGVNGRLVSSKTNSNSIFLPAAGYRGDNLYGAGSYGRYWSSFLGTGYTSDAWYFIFFSNPSAGGISPRYYGFSVRPVCPKE